MLDNQEKFRIMTSLYHALAIACNGVRKTKCPHCQVDREVPILPLSPIVVCICEDCKGYVIPFVGELLPLPLGAIKDGTDVDRRWAVEQSIMKFLHDCVRDLMKWKVEESGDTGVSGVPEEF